MSRFSSSGSLRNPVVVGRDAMGEPFMWLLPELVLYWVASRSETNHKVHSEARFIRVVIPPAGSRQLLRTDSNSSLTRTYRWGMQNQRVLEMSVIHRGQAIERAHHQLICYSAGNQSDGNRWNHSQHRASPFVQGSHEADAKIHNWNDRQAVVVVHEKSDSSVYQENHGPYAAMPEGIFCHVEERELVDSLPLC
jgi:hypothetical protein